MQRSVSVRKQDTFSTVMQGMVGISDDDCNLISVLEGQENEGVLTSCEKWEKASAENEGPRGDWGPPKNKKNCLI